MFLLVLLAAATIVRGLFPVARYVHERASFRIKRECHLRRLLFQGSGGIKHVSVNYSIYQGNKNVNFLLTAGTIVRILCIKLHERSLDGTYNITSEQTCQQLFGNNREKLQIVFSIVV